MPITDSEIILGSLKWGQALDVVGKKDEKKVSALLTKLVDLESPYLALSALNNDNMAPLLDLIAKAQQRAFEEQPIGKLSFARKPLTLRQWERMTSNTRWFYQRWAYKIRLLFSGYGLYLRSRNITPSSDLRKQLARWADLSSASVKPQFQTLQALLKGLPNPETTGIKKANVVNPMELWRAINEGSEEDVRRLLEEDPKLVNENSHLLEEALKCKHVAIAKLLIEKGADLTKLTSKGYPLSDQIYLSQDKDLLAIIKERNIPIASFYTAMQLDDFEAFKTLASDPAKLNAPDQDGNTPLHLALNVKQFPIIDYYNEKFALHLVKNGADLFAKDAHGQTPFECVPFGFSDVREEMQKNANPQNLFQAITCGNLEKVKTFAGDETLRNGKDASGNTPLHHAVRLGSFETIKILREKGADLTSTNRWGLTPSNLLYIEKRYYIDLLNPSFLENIQYDAKFPLHQAIKDKRLTAIDPDHLDERDSYGKFPLEIALEIKDEDLINRVLDAKPNVHLFPLSQLYRGDFPSDATYEKFQELRLCLPTSYPRNEEGFPLLYAAIASEDLDFIEAVMKLKPPKHLLPLHFAIEQHKGDAILRTLLDCGADLAATDADGNTPLHLISSSIFFEYNPPLHSKNQAGQTPLKMQKAQFKFFPPNFEYEGFRYLDYLLMALAAYSSKWTAAINTCSGEELNKLHRSMEACEMITEPDSAKLEASIAADLANLSQALNQTISEADLPTTGGKHSEIVRRLKSKISERPFTEDKVEQTLADAKKALADLGITEDSLPTFDPYSYQGNNALKIRQSFHQFEAVQKIRASREHVKTVKEILKMDEIPSENERQLIGNFLTFSSSVRKQLQRGANPNLTCTALGCTTLAFATQYRKHLGDDLYSAILLAARLT